MKNGYMPANAFDMDCDKAGMGLTKREMIAMHIMAQTCWNTTDMNNPQHYNYAAESAVKMTDALLKELEKQQ